jgi:hypothetical protein
MSAKGRYAIRLAVALLLGVTLHAAWVAVFILGASLGASGIAKGGLWLAAPIMTAAGYATGLTIPVRGAAPLKGRFSQVFVGVWIGCALGGIIGSRVGPMFIGLGVLGAGALAALTLAICTARRQTDTNTE